MCDDTCKYHNDGMCTDGGPGSAYTNCARGTDCTDCGASTRTEEDKGGTCAPHVPWLATCHCDDTCRFHNNGICEDSGPGSNGTQYCARGTDCWDCGLSNRTRAKEGAHGAAACVHVDRCTTLSMGFGTKVGGTSYLNAKHANYWMVHPPLGHRYTNYTSNDIKPRFFARGDWGTGALCKRFFEDLADPAVGPTMCGKTYPTGATHPNVPKTCVLDCGNTAKQQPRVSPAYAVLSICVKSCAPAPPVK